VDQIEAAAEGVTPLGAVTVCLACRWVSRPHMRKTDDGVHVVHPAGLVG